MSFPCTELEEAVTQMISFIYRVSRCDCNCQTNATEVDRNFHRSSCWVGKAQRLIAKWEKTRSVHS